MSFTGIYRGMEYESLRRGEDILRNSVAWFASAADQKACLKNISLRSGEASFASTNQKVWALCLCPPPLRFIKILKIIKARMPKKIIFFCKTVKRNGDNIKLGEKRI